MMNPKISIVTISYNSANYIEETIKSIIGQNYENKEYIIIDGGSTDNTLSIVNRYKDHIDYFISEQDKGISDAFNKGIRAANGDIIGIINSDDLLEEGALQAIATAYQEDIDVYRGNTIIWNESINYSCIEIPTMKFSLIPLKFHICHPSTFISKKAYEKFGLYKVEYKSVMDVELLVRYSVLDAKPKYIDYNLATFRLGGTSQNNDKIKIREFKKMIYENGGNFYHYAIFISYFFARISARDFLNFLGKDLRYKFIGKKIK